MPAARPTEALIERSLRAWQACGLPVGAVEVRPDGSIRISAIVAAVPVALPETGADAWDAKIKRKAGR